MARKMGSTARARRLRRELRFLRAEAGMSTDEAGARSGMSGPTISRIESGKRGVSVDETEVLLDVYGVSLTRQRKILEIAEHANELGWWQVYEGHLTEGAQSLIAFEEEASTITNFELVLIPGLLQTDEYARAIIQASNFDDSARAIEAKVAVRMARQAVLTRPDAPEFCAFLDEAVLHRFHDPKIMNRQLRHLIEAAKRPNISIQVVPFSVGHHASAESSCVIYEFGEEAPIVVVESKVANLFLEEPDEAAIYQEVVRRLGQVALSPSASIETIDRIAKELA